MDENLTTVEAQLEKIISNLEALNEALNPSDGGES